MKLIRCFVFLIADFFVRESDSFQQEILNCIEVERLFETVGNLTYCKITTNVKITTINCPITIKSNYQQTTIKSNYNGSLGGVAFENQEILYFPKLSTDRNLRIFIIKNSSLKQISSSNLKDYKSLKVLDLSENLLVYLEKDLLRYNLNLKFFDINSNRIEAIHSTVFESLQKLSYFNILYNKCATQATFSSSHAIQNGMTNLKTLCMNDYFLQLSQANNTIKNERSENLNLSKENSLLRSKMSTFETITIITLGCVIAALIFYIIRKNCKKSSNERFHSKVSDKVDMFEETSSIYFSSTAGGLNDYPVRGVASNFNTLNGNQSTLAEDGLPENLINEYADPIMLTKQDIEQRLQNSTNYANSEVNLSHNAPSYQNCGQLKDGSDVRYQNYPFGRSRDNLDQNSTLDIHDVGKKKQKDGQRSAQYANFIKGAVSTESIGNAKFGTTYANYPQNVNQKLMTSPQNAMTHSISDLYSLKHPDSSTISSNYDSSTQKSVKTAEIGRKTVKYTNISRAPSQTEIKDQNVTPGQPQVPKTDDTPSGNPIIPTIQTYSSQSSTSSTGSIRRPKNIPNLQKSKFMDNINQKLQVITPRDNKPFEFPGPKSTGIGSQGQKVSKTSSQKKNSSKKSFRSVGVHQSPTELTVNSPKTPDFVGMHQKQFDFNRIAQQSLNLPGSTYASPDIIQNNSNTGTFSLKSSTAFSLNLSGNGNQQGDQKSRSIKGAKSPTNDNAPRLPSRNNLTLNSTQNRESIDVDYIEPLSNSNEHQLYAEPYRPSKV